jgi:Leucine-rich repeat (LRR) protein
MGKLKQLEKLVVEHAKYVSDDGLENIREGLPRLRTLGLSDNELVTINGVTRLVENSRITTLVLERCTNLRPIDAVIKEIQRLRPGIAVHIS